MSDARPPLGPDDVEGLLRRLERPAAPDDMLAKVRARLAAERAAQSTPTAPSDVPSADVPPMTLPDDDGVPSERSAPAFRRWAVEGLVFAAAAAALVIAVQVGQGLPKGGNPAAEAAGIGAEGSAVVDVHLRARSLDDAVVRRLAAAAGLSMVEGPDGVAFEGGATDVRRFLVSLRVEAARAGGSVSGFVPEAGQLRLTVATE